MVRKSLILLSLLSFIGISISCFFAARFLILFDVHPKFEDYQVLLFLSVMAGVFLTTAVALFRRAKKGFFKKFYPLALLLLVPLGAAPPDFSSDTVDALKSANSVVLYSIHPGELGRADTFRGTEIFHGWEVMGKTELTGKEASVAANEF